MAKRQAGFTLIEMMIVLTIMGSMAALLAPGIGEYIADGRAAAATDGLVRLSRHVRARAQETGLAHLVSFANTDDAAGAHGLGRALVYEGMNNHCRQTPWPQTTAENAATNGHAPVDALDLGDGSFNPPLHGTDYPSASDHARQVIQVIALDGETKYDKLSLCFEPSGNVWMSTATNATKIGFAFVRQVRPITMSVQRSLNGVSRGVDRSVVFQAGGIARFSY